MATDALPPKLFDPVGVEFVVGSISSPGTLEAAEHRLKSDAPLRGMYLADRPGASKPEPTINMLVRHGVRSALEYANSGDIEKARALCDAEWALLWRRRETGFHLVSNIHSTESFSTRASSAGSWAVWRWECSEKGKSFDRVGG